MNIRMATMKDYNLFCKMYSELFPCEFKEDQYISKDAYRVNVRNEQIYFPIINGKEGGFITVRAFDDGNAYILHFYIRKKGRGYGTAFYKEMEKIIKEVGCKKISLISLDDKSDNFWIRQGFSYQDEGEWMFKIIA